VSASAKTRFLAVAFSVLMLVSAMGIGILGGAGLAQAQSDDVIERVNAGGPSVSGTPDWTGDASGSQYSSGGSTYSAAQSSGLTASDITNPTDAPSEVFLTERYGDHSWSFDVTAGTEYEVRLYFAEIYHGVNTASADTGDRVFDASIEGQQVLNDYDIVAETGGATTATVETFDVTPTDGTLDVSFTTEVDNAKISAIEIVEATPEPGVLSSPSNVDFGTVVTGDSATETVTVTNEGESGDVDITVDDVSVTGTDADEFSADFSGSTTLAPGESADIPVTFTPSSVDPKSATLEVAHDAPNTTSPLTVGLSGEGASATDPDFGKSKLQGFSAGNPTALEWGPDGRLYVSTQGGTVYALDVDRTGENSYQVVNEVQIDAIKDIPNHDDFGNIESESNRQITGLTVGGTADQPVVYVGSSDPEIDVGQDDDDTDTNSGAISRLTVNPGSDGVLQASEVTHDVMVLGLPRSEENHATNGLDLTPDGDTLYVAQGGHTNKGAPGDNFGHTPEYALSAAVLEIDLAQIETNHQAKTLNNYNSTYPNLDFYYAIPTIQNDDATDGDDLPFGGNDGINQAKLIEGGPVQVYSPGYRNPYDLVLTEDGQLYVSDHGPNGGWGGQPADASGNIVADAASVTNHPNEDGSFSTNDQLIGPVQEGDYAGHAAPIRANPTQADIYDASGNVKFDITESNSPVPSSMVNPVEADYIPPTSNSPDPGAPAGSANTMETTSGQKVLFGPTGGTEEYTASNFDGAMQGDILQVELGGDIERIELNAAGDTVTNQETIFNTGGPLGIDAQGDSEKFAGTVWTANHGGNDITVFEPVDGISQCTGADDASLDEDGDGYDNADEIDAGTDPCSAGSTPVDFDDDGESNLNDPDDDNDGQPDTSDPFAVDPDDGTTTSLPVQHDLSELSLFGDNGQGWTGVMTNGQDDYQDLYDPTKMTVGGAAEVLTVEEVPPGDAYQTPNDQQYAFQFGVNPPDEPFTVETTVASFPDNPEDFQSAGIQIGPGDQSNYVKLVAAADGGNGGVEFAKEVDDSFSHPTSPNVVSDSAVAGGTTTLRMTVDPTTDPDTSNSVDEVAVTAEYVVDGNTTEVGTGAMPASWLDTSDGSGLAVGVISTSNGASSPFSATWTDISVDYVNAPENQPPTADAGADQTVDEDSQVTLDASGSDDPDGDQLGYTWTQTAGPDVSPSQNDGETLTFTAPDVDSETTLTFQVSVSDGQASDTDAVNVTVQNTDTPPTEGEVVYRVNAGGQEVAASDDGPAWSADTDGSPSQYVNADGDNGLNTYSTTDTITLDSSASGTPTSLFQTERYDVNTSGSTADDTEMQYSFPVTQGETYEVRLYFAEIFLESTSDNQYPREFAVTVEGDTKLDNYNIFDQYGHDVGAMESFQVTPSDGTIDMEFLHQQENPKVSAIEIVAVGDTGDLTVAEAVAAHDDGDDTINLNEIQTAINWWSTGAEVPNTGGETISLQQMQQLINIWSTDATVGDGGGNTAPTIDAISDQTVTEGETSQVSVSASDSNGDSLTLSKTSGPDFVTLTDNGDGTGALDITPQSGDAGTYTVTVEAADGNGGTATESFQLTVEDTSTGATSADVTVNSATSNIDASTFNGGSFEVTNTGDEQVSSVEIDLSESAIPDAVFDPQGTAGDSGAKGLVIDSESGDGVGVVSTTDGDVFSQPQNGQDGSDGYKAMTIEFSDFDAGETVAFSVDIDPTTIKGVSTTGGEGSVSGLELSGSAVTVSSSSATVSNDLFTDGSQGGSQSSVSSDASAAPTLGVDGVTLQSTDFPAHQAATVSSTSQTLTLSGPDDATVELLTIEASAPPSDGYDVDAFEADNAEAVSTQPVTLDSNGEATVSVSLSESNLNYFQAAVQDGSGATGMVSQTVVLDVQTNTAPSIDTISDQTVVTGENVVVPVSASDAEGDSVSLSKSNGPEFVTLTDNGDGTGSLEIAPESADAGTYTVEVTADDGSATTPESFQLTVDTATSTTSGTVLHRVNAGETTTVSATDGGPNWTGVDSASTDGPLVSLSDGNTASGATCSGDEITPGSEIPSSTPDAVYDCEQYGTMTWEFDVTQGSEVEVRLYMGNSFTGADTDGDRQYNVGIEGQQVLTEYDPVQDVGDDTGTVKAFTATENGDGTVTITFDPGAVENPEVRAIEIVQTSDGSSS
jgi:hypothetical protein